jgi:hypothetical protein
MPAQFSSSALRRSLARIGLFLTRVPLDFDALLAAAQLACEARPANAAAAQLAGEDRPANATDLGRTE